MSSASVLRGRPLGVEVAARVDDAEGAVPALVDALGSLLSPAEEVLDEADVQLEVRRAAGWEVAVGGTVVSVHESVPGMVAGVLRALNRSVLAVAHRATTVLHAAAVDVAGDVVLLVAPSGSGKTTLAAQLVSQGAGYVTDEAVALEPDLAVRGHPKPISLKPGSWPVFPVLAEGRHAQDEWLVSPHELGGLHARTPGHVRLVVLPQYEQGAATTWSTVPASVAVCELARSTFAFREHGERDLRLLATLVRSVPVRAVVHGGGDDVARQLLDEVATP